MYTILAREGQLHRGRKDKRSRVVANFIDNEGGKFSQPQGQLHRQ